MNESRRRRWCLYLPGLCIHAVPVAPGRHEELHVQHRRPHGFHFYHLYEPRSTNEQEEPIYYPQLPLSLYPGIALEPELPHSLYIDVHPALRGPQATSPPSPLLLPKLPAKTSTRFRLPLPWLSSRRRPLQRPPIPDFTLNMPAMHSEASKPGALSPRKKLINHDKAFENTSTSVAASQMRNALNQLADTVKDPEEKKVQIQSRQIRVNIANKL
jgi:UTP--glucose-1-phosphate uridylyltransferase